MHDDGQELVSLRAGSYSGHLRARRGDEHGISQHNDDNQSNFEYNGKTTVGIHGSLARAPGSQMGVEPSPHRINASSASQTKIRNSFFSCYNPIIYNISLGVYFLSSKASGMDFMLSGIDWIFLILLGAGPMGSAFLTWDAALKRGDPRIIGSLTYLTPLLSTINLVVFGGRSMSLVSIIATLLIIFGAVIGSLDLFRPQIDMGVRVESRS